MLKRHSHFQSVVCISGKCYTCETEHAVCQLQNHVVYRMEVAKQMAATNVTQLPVEKNAQKVKSFKKKKDRASKFSDPYLSLSEHHSMEKNK